MVSVILAISLFSFAVVPLLFGCGDHKSEGESAAAWVGHTYLATPAEPYTYLTSPSNSLAAEQMAEFIPNFLLKVTHVAGDELSVTIAAAKKQTDPPEQDRCNATVDTVATVSSNPKLRIGPIDFPLYITNPPTGSPAVTVLATVREFSLTDVLPNGSMVSEIGKMSALVDAREVSPLINVLRGQSPESVCAAMKKSFSTDCVPCPDSQVLCLRLEAEEFGAAETTVEVTSRSQADLDANCPKP